MYVISGQMQTRRERLKSAPYPRLKKRKVFKIVEGGTLRGFLKILFVAKYQKNEGATLRRLWEISKKKRKMRIFNSRIVPKNENVKGGPFRLFQHPFSCKTPKK